MSSFAAELSTDGGKSFAANGRRFATKDEALRHAEEIMQRWLAVTDWRAVPSDQEPNAVFDKHQNRAVEIPKTPKTTPEAMACAQSAAENIGVPIQIEDTPIATPTPMSNITLPTELQAKADALLSLVAQHVGTATFQRISAFVLAKTGTKLQAFLTDASKSIEERAGVIDELTKILQTQDWTKLPPVAGAQAAAPKTTLAPAPVMAPVSTATPAPNGLKPAFTVPTNGVACTPTPAVPPTQVLLTPPPAAPAPADPMAALTAALAALMPKPAVPATPAIDEAAVRKLVREEMASVLASVVEALRQ